MLVVVETDLGQIELTLALDIDAVRAINEDVANAFVPKQRLERAGAQELVFNFLDEAKAIGFGEETAFFGENLTDGLGNFRGGHILLEAFEAGNVEGLEQAIVDGELELLEAVGKDVAGAAGAVTDNRSGTGSTVGGG